MASGSPEYIGRGAKDGSYQGEVLKRIERGQLVLNAFAFAAKGPSKHEGTITDLLQVFGENTFSEMSKFYTHTTKFINRFGAPGSKVVFNRIEPDDMKCPANITVYVDWVKDKGPNYLRDSQGNYVIDSNTNQPKVDPDTPEIDVIKIKFIEDYVSNVSLYAPELRRAEPKAGTMVNSDGEASTMIPLLQANARYRGSEYNLCGFGFNPVYEEDLDTDLVSELKAMQYDLVLYTKPSQDSAAKIFPTLFNENSARCVLKDKAVNPATNQKVSYDALFRKNWYNESTDTGIDVIRYNDYEDIYLYRNNLEMLLKEIVELEKEHFSYEDKTWADGITGPNSNWFDFSDVDLTDEEYLVNIFTCKSSKNVPYYSVMISKETPNLTGNQKEINIAKNTPIMLKGGSDGTVNNETLNRKTKEKLEEYGDSFSLLLDPVLHPENFFVDSGFDLDTKLAAFNFIGLRKDTCMLLSPYDYTKSKEGKELSISEQLSVLMAVNSRAQLAPESPYFGTKCARAAFVMGSGVIETGDIERVPLTYNLMGYMTDMMGALNYKWKKEFIFDDSCYVNELKDVEPRGIPNPTKKVLWNAGAIFPTPTDRGQPKLGGLQTLYPYTASVVNNIFTMVALCTCDRVARSSWLDLHGNLRDAPGKFLAKATKDLNKRHDGLFADMYISIPRPYFTPEDTINGNSWHVETELQGNIAKTNCTHHTNVTRIGDE